MKAVTLVVARGLEPRQAWRWLRAPVILLLVLTVSSSVSVASAWADTGGQSPAGSGSQSWGNGNNHAPQPDPGWPGWSVATKACRHAFDEPAAGSLVKTTSAGPNDSTVLPGQTITVTLRWTPGEFLWTAPSAIADCVEIGTHVSAVLSQVHAPGPAGGTDTFSYVVPANGTNGQLICDRGIAWGRLGVHGEGSENGHDETPGNGHDDGWGHGDDTERSAVLCYEILGAVTPEAPSALLFPLAGLAIGGGALVVYRRRRHTAPVE